jgi:hypothetical protein
MSSGQQPQSAVSVVWLLTGSHDMWRACRLHHMRKQCLRGMKVSCFHSRSGGLQDTGATRRTCTVQGVNCSHGAAAAPLAACVLHICPSPTRPLGGFFCWPSAVSDTGTAPASETRRTLLFLTPVLIEMHLALTAPCPLPPGSYAVHVSRGRVVLGQEEPPSWHGVPVAATGSVACSGPSSNQVGPIQLLFLGGGSSCREGGG